MWYGRGWGLCYKQTKEILINYDMNKCRSLDNARDKDKQNENEKMFEELIYQDSSQLIIQ